MPNSDPVNWQPISQMPLITSMIDGTLENTREHLATLTSALSTPHLLDDATIDRSKRVHDEQLEFVGIYDQQIARWKATKPSAAVTTELDRMEVRNTELRDVTDQVLALGQQLRTGTIDRVLGMSDLELGLRAMRGDGFGRRR